MKLCTYKVSECSECAALRHVSELPADTQRGRIGFICTQMDEPVEHINRIDSRCPLPDYKDTDYGLCHQDCTKCEYNEKDDCGLDYNGEPRTPFKEAVCILLIFIFIIIMFILLAQWGILQ